MTQHLQPNQFECTLYLYGYPQDGIILARGTSEKMAGILIGTESRMFDGHVGEKACLISYRLEDDTPDGTKGRVIAICELVEQCETIYYTVDSWTEGTFDVRYLRPGKAVLWFSKDGFADPGEASQEFLAQYRTKYECEYVELADLLAMAQPQPKHPTPYHPQRMEYK